MKRRFIASILLCAATAAHAAIQVEVVRMIARPSDVNSRAAALAGWLTGKRDAFLFERPYAVAWDGEALLVADPAAHRVVRIDGTRVRSTAEGALEEPIGVASCEAGVIVTDSVSGKVILFDRNLRKPRVIASGVKRPTGVTCRGEDVFVVVTGEHRILALNASSGTTRSIGQRGDRPSEFNFPAAITLSGSSLYVGDTLNFRVQQIEAASGSFVASVGGLGDGEGDTPRIKGVAVDAAHRIWISDAHLDRLSVFGPDGKLVAEIGGPGNGEGQFSFPAGLAIAADGRIAVVDSLNRRIQILRVSEGGQR